MKKITIAITALLFIVQACNTNTGAQTKKSEIMNSKKEHYTFELSDKVTRQKVSFKNRYGITLSGDLYIPKNIANGKLSAIAISTFGAVKEQSSGLYANQMAERGFIAF
jgi:protein involved in sex pheromone biosynthesis